MKANRAKIQRAVISLLLAVFIWGGLQLQGEASKKIVLPIEFKNLPDGLVVADAGAQNVSLALRGSPARMARLDVEDMKVVVDMKDVEPGNSKVFVSEEKIERLPDGLEIEEITPYALNVSVEPLVEKEITVVPRVEGDVAQNYLLDSVTAVPAKVRFRGPSSIAKTLENVATAKLDISDLRESVERRVELETNPRVLPYLEKPVVDLQIRLSEKVIDKVIEGVRVVPQVGAGTRVSLTPPQVRLTVTGTVSKLSGLTAESFEVKAEARGYTPGKYKAQKLRMSFRVDPPRDGLHFDYEPKEFDLIVTQ